MNADSTLVNAVIPSPNFTQQRKYKIDMIVVHCMAGNLSIETCGKLFANPSKQASSHYGIGSDGRIGQYVEEKYRAWTTGGSMSVNGLSGSDIDHRAITIEVANCTLAPWWAITGEAMNSLILLLADIAKRNGIPKLLWANDKSLVGKMADGRPVQTLALHRWFAKKACPGDFIIQCLPSICEASNTLLEGGTTSDYMINGYDYSPVFDPVYYSNRYADLKMAFGDNPIQLWNHFCQFGMNEFRQASDEFNPEVYKARYPDLVAAFGDDNPMYYYHYVAFGISEGRSAI